MKNKRIDEIEAHIEHLERRLDNLRDNIQENLEPINAKYYWCHFEDLLAWSLKFDKNSEEYKKLTQAGWEMLDQYLELMLTKGLNI